MTTLLISHTDLDGAGAIILLDYFKFYYDKLMCLNYDDVTPDKEEIYKDFLTYDKIVCTDFSLPKEKVEELLAIGKIIEIYDHHESSEPLKEITHPNYKIIHDQTKAGTLIVFEQFKPSNVRVKKIIRQFAELCSTYDLYKTKDPLWEDAQNINRVLWGCLNWDGVGAEKFSFIKDFWFNKMNNNNEWFWSEFEKKKIASAVASENKAYIEAKSTYKEYIDEKGLKFGIFVVNKKVSITANRILNDKPNIDYVVVVNTYEGWGKLSLRSLDKFDCTKIANGHRNAGGMTVSQEDAIALYKGTKNLPYKLES